MKFGYFCNSTNWDKKPYDRILEEAREITTYCDSNNWNSIWYTEHHFNHEGMEACSNPLMMCADSAARTKQIRIGQACNVITFHNPIRLAEDIALLDQMSKGRVEIGIGRGIYGREAIKILRHWAIENIDFDYAIYPVDKANIASRKIAESLGGMVIKERKVKTMRGRYLDEVVYKIPKTES